ncbi:MAG: site-2 protease family protein [Ruminiclostridium sp.]|nr:site-2 protease family protein [Ruminiclostridium sp.]
MFTEDLGFYILMIPVMLITLTFHEFSHGYIAWRLGDDTAKNAGRLTLNPLKHLDPIGTLMMFVARIGWAKPVPVNPSAFKDKKKGMMLTSIAGPISNLLMAFIVAFLLQVVLVLGFSSIYAETGAVYWLFQFLLLLFYVNINLAVFNLFPIPPLDGSKILSAVLPTELYFRVMRYEQYIGLAFLVIVVFFGKGFGEVINFFTKPISSSMLWIAAKVVGIFL